MIVAAFSDNIALGNILIMVTIVSVAYGLRSSMRSRADWKSVSEADKALLEQEKAKVAALIETKELLTRSLEEEKRKTDVQPVLELVGLTAGSVHTMAKHVETMYTEFNDHRTDLDEHRKDYAADHKEAAAVNAAITATLQQFGLIIKDMGDDVSRQGKDIIRHDSRALDRHEALTKILDRIAADVIRDKTERTRSTDNPGGQT